MRDQRSKHTAKRLLKRFRANELRVYYDLTFKQVQSLHWRQCPPQDAAFWDPAFRIIEQATSMPPAQPGFHNPASATSTEIEECGTGRRRRRPKAPKVSGRRPALEKIELFSGVL